MAEPAASPDDPAPGGVRTVLRSWRLLSVTLLSFSSGLPLGLVWMALPAWLKRAGVDLTTVGLVTLVQAPWSFKFLWSPLMDRFSPPLLGRKRGWILVTQGVLFLLGLAMAAAARPPLDVMAIAAIALAMAFASASQDIAYDAYAVEVLHREEHGLAVGSRNALARLALLLSGRVSITVASWVGWPLVHALLSACYLPSMAVTVLAPEPEARPVPPRSLRQAVWEPLLDLLGQHRALEILAFVILYKLGDNLTQALTGPFLVDMGFSDVDVGVAVGTIGLVGSLVGAFAGGLLAQRLGLGPALWVCGILQIVSNAGYAVVAQAGPQRLVMYSAVGFELLTSGMGTGAFGVFLLRLTQKQFSATQFALLSSLFAIPRVFSGPVAGFLADALGWRDFYLLTLVTGLPGLVMLQRFAPWGVREPALHAAEPRYGPPRPRAQVVAAGLAAALAGTLAAGLCAALLAAVRGLRDGRAFELEAPVMAVLQPATATAWLTSLGVLVFGAVSGLATAAAFAARGRQD